MNAKRRKVEHPTVEDLKTDFLSMNSDCIYKIFEWLELDDLCSVSETCKQLQALASDYFKRKYNDKLSDGIHIVASNGKIELQPKERYVKSFSRCFDTVIVNGDSRWGSNIDISKVALPLIIRENCNEDLRTIQFYSMVLHPSFGDGIMNNLENVETVLFLTCDLEDTTYHNILKHCRNLKSLTIDGNYGNKIDELLLETYPELEEFNCRYYGRVLMINNLKKFLKNHPNLKRMTWCFHARIQEATFNDKTLECIDIIMENGQNLEELSISFDGIYDLIAICDKLEKLSNRNHFKRLTLDFRYIKLGYKVNRMMIEQGHQLKTLTMLYGLHLCDFSEYGSSMLPTITSMNNLRILQLDYVASIRGLAKTSLGSLASLEELHIHTLENVKFAQQFICQVKTLRIFTILSCKFSTSRFNIPKLNIERRKLPFGACEVTIYVDITTTKVNTGAFIDGDLVKIEYIDFQMEPINLSKPEFSTINDQRIRFISAKANK